MQHSQDIPNVTHHSSFSACENAVGIIVETLSRDLQIPLDYPQGNFRFFQDCNFSAFRLTFYLFILFTLRKQTVRCQELVSKALFIYLPEVCFLYSVESMKCFIYEPQTEVFKSTVNYFMWNF